MNSGISGFWIFCNPKFIEICTFTWLGAIKDQSQMSHSHSEWEFQRKGAGTENENVSICLLCLWALFTSTQSNRNWMRIVRSMIAWHDVCSLSPYACSISSYCRYCIVHKFLPSAACPSMEQTFHFPRIPRKYVHYVHLLLFSECVNRIFAFRELETMITLTNPN